MTHQEPLLQHASVVDGWFREVNDVGFPGQAFALRVKRILYTGRSAFQDILVFESTDFGNVLVLDGIIQCTERDEFAYQEMIAHVPLYCHETPRRVLVIGGGDGGVVREVLKHFCVEHVTLVEIDETVIELSKKFLPGMSVALNGGDDRFELKLCDGFQYLRDTPAGTFDVIITDSSDPEGPAEAFFQSEYFKLLHQALAPEGIVIAQASENVWLNLNYLGRLMETARGVFPNVNYCYTMVPSYTSGQLGLVVCSKDSSLQLTDPARVPTEQEQTKLKYYNRAIHGASFVLPTWARAPLEGSKQLESCL